MGGSTDFVSLRLCQSFCVEEEIWIIYLTHYYLFVSLMSSKHLTDAQYSELRALFNRYDINRDGRIDKDELGNALLGMKVVYSLLMPNEHVTILNNCV